MKRSLVAASAALCLAASASAFSQSAFTPGWYAGLSIGQGKADFTPSSIGLDTGSVDDKDTTLGARLGYEFNPWFGLELAYYDLGKYSFNGTVLGLPTNGDARAKAYNISAVGTLPLSDSFAAYGKIGYGRSRLEAGINVAGFSGSPSDWESEAVYGIGAKWKVDRSWGVFAEWMRNDDLKLDNYMVGTYIRF